MNVSKLLGTLHKPYKPELYYVLYHCSNLPVVMKEIQDCMSFLKQQGRKPRFVTADTSVSCSVVF